MRTCLRSAWRPLSFIARRSADNIGRRPLLTQAFDIGPTKPPLLERTIPEHFASIVSRHGDRPAVISRHQRTHLTYERLDHDSNGLARGLEARGVHKGSRVAVFLGNNIEFATLTYALFKIGGILVPLNPAFTPSQVAAALSHLSASHLIISSEANLPRKPPIHTLAILQHLVPDLEARNITSETVPSLESIILVDNSDGRSSLPGLSSLTPYADLLSGIPSDARPLPNRDLHKNDVVNIQFTSGTTSTPKAASLTHRSILNNGYLIGARLGLTPHDVICCPPPLFHCFGCVLGYMATATHGSAIVFPSESFDPVATLHSVHEYAGTGLYGVPTMFLSELSLLQSSPDAFPKEGFKQLRTGIAAGSQVPSTLMKRLHAELNLTELCNCYGMTETSPVSVMTRPDDPIDKRVETVGKLMPHTTTKVVVRDTTGTERVANIGERGELAASGYLVMKGYWGDAERTAEVLKTEKYTDTDGTEKERTWMYTGDEAVMDAEGYVKITGRLKDIIIRGGENIHPLDVENVLLQHEHVAEVSAFGVPDERYGEVVGVAIVMREGKELGEQQVRDFVRRHLANHLVPKYVFLVDTLPKTPSGKIQRYVLRKDAVEKLGIKT